MSKKRKVEFIKDHVMFIDGKRTFCSSGYNFPNGKKDKGVKKKYLIDDDIAIQLMDKKIVKDTRRKKNG